MIGLVALDDHVPVAALGDALHEQPTTAGGGYRVARLHVPGAGSLGQAAQDSDRVLLVAGSDTAWRGSCIRQADRLIVATVGPDPCGLAAIGDRPDILVSGSQPSTAQIVAWHDRYNCRRVYHAGSEPASWRHHPAPLVARLGGTSVALALAGGGARALAHIGVLQAFEDAAIAVDRVAGTSMGAMIAALFATGASAGEIESVIFEEFVQRNPFGDYRPSLVSRARGERGKEMLKRRFGEARLEAMTKAMTKEIVVVSTDLYDRRPVCHRRDLTAEAVAASIYLPVLSPRPVSPSSHRRPGSRRRFPERQLSHRRLRPYERRPCGRGADRHCLLRLTISETTFDKRNPFAGRADGRPA